jgi:mannan endo-1,6-alpha-mannosidase
MAQAVFNEQASRWDAAQCGGGLRWQIFSFNNGYNYKNVAANGGLFLLAARLGRYTGNQTYIDWAEKEWDWFSNSVLYDNTTNQINDGTSIDQNCTQADHTQWSYNYGFFIGGLAFMYNQTGDPKWLTPLEGILKATYTRFFPVSMGPDIAVEITCQPTGNCNNDALTFRGFLLRWMSFAAQLVPQLADGIWPYLSASGIGAAGQCSGGDTGQICGIEWNTTVWDGTYGPGQQMSALAAVGANMLKVKALAPPFTTKTGGTSVSDPSAGTNGDNTGQLPEIYTNPISTSDRAGAGIVTALLLVGILGIGWWMVSSG